MKIKATTILQFTSFRDEQVMTRLEIQWAEDESWLNLGEHDYQEFEWALLLSCLALGARRAGVDFVHNDLRDKFLSPIAAAKDA